MDSVSYNAGAAADDTKSVQMTFDSLMGYLEKQHGPLKVERGGWHMFK